MTAFTAAVALRDAPPARRVETGMDDRRARRLGRRVRVSGRRARPVHLRPDARSDVRSGPRLRRHAGGCDTRGRRRGDCRGHLLAYNTAAFGRPFTWATRAKEGFEELHTGLFGISRPEWWRVREILIWQLPRSPADCAARGGHAHRPGPAGRLGHRVAPAMTAAAVGGLYFWCSTRLGLLLGRRVGVRPRQVVPALPFLALGLAPLWDGVRRRPAASCWPARGCGAPRSRSSPCRRRRTAGRDQAAGVRSSCCRLSSKGTSRSTRSGSPTFAPTRTRFEARGPHRQLESGDGDGPDRPREPFPPRRRLAGVRNLADLARARD